MTTVPEPVSRGSGSGFTVAAVLAPDFALLLLPVPVIRTATRARASTAEHTPPASARDLKRLASAAASVVPPLAARRRSLTVPTLNSVTWSSCPVVSVTASFLSGELEAGGDRVEDGGEFVAVDQTGGGAAHDEAV